MPRLQDVDFDRLAELKADEVPGMEFCSHWRTDDDHLRGLIEAIRSNNEPTIQKYLSENPFLLKFLLPTTGNHGFWVKPEPAISNRDFEDTPGKKPDFLVCAQNSNGFQWFVIELKLPGDSLFRLDAGGLSGKCSKSLTQLMSYMAYIDEHQSALRDTLKVPTLRGPVKGCLVMGTREEVYESTKSQEMKRIWNVFLDRIEIISYNRILQEAAQHYHMTINLNHIIQGITK